MLEGGCDAVLAGVGDAVSEDGGDGVTAGGKGEGPPGGGDELGQNNCVDGRACAGKDIQVGAHKCSQCQQPLCTLCSGQEDADEEVFCFSCKGGNKDNPLSFKTWTTSAERSRRLAMPRKGAAVVRTPGATTNAGADSSAAGAAGTVVTAGAAGTASITVAADAAGTVVAADAASITGAADAASTVVTAGAASTILTESEEADLKCELWQEVCHDLENGASERVTAAKFRVGRKWIARRRKLQGLSVSKKSGQVLTNSEEKLLLDTLLLRQNLGVPLSRFQLRLAVQGLLLDVTEADPTRTTGWEDRSQFPNLNWVFRFMKRHKLSLRTKIPMKLGRESLTEEEVRFWAECTKEFFQKHKEITVDPRRILNLDESAISQDTNGLKVIVKVGTKGAVQARDGDRDYSTLVMCITAAGEILKPAVVMKGQRDVSAAHMQRLNFPEHLQPRILFAKKGFVDQPGMIKVLETVHQSCLDKGIELPVVLLLDCATCHLSKNAISRAEQLGLHLWYIHPCATSILQPLDISFFGPLKMGYKQRIQVAVGKGIKMTRWT